MLTQEIGGKTEYPIPRPASPQLLVVSDQVFLFFTSLGALWKKIPWTFIQCLWQVCRLRDDLLPSLCVLQDRPSAQSQRWNISKPWVPFLLCFVQTWPSFRTGLQILDQKWRAQQSPSAQSDDLRQFSPSRPLKTKQHSWIPCTSLKMELILKPGLGNKFHNILLLC